MWFFLFLIGSSASRIFETEYTRATTTLEMVGNRSINQFNNQSIHHQSEVGEWVISCYRGAHWRLIGVVVIGSSTEEYLFHFAEVQSVLVVRPKLHETHIARLGQFRYALYAREESVEKVKNNKSYKWIVILQIFIDYRVNTFILSLWKLRPVLTILFPFNFYSNFPFFIIIFKLQFYVVKIIPNFENIIDVKISNNLYIWRLKRSDTGNFSRK